MHYIYSRYLNPSTKGVAMKKGAKAVRQIYQMWGKTWRQEAKEQGFTWAADTLTLVVLEKARKSGLSCPSADYLESLTWRQAVKLVKETLKV